MKLGFNLLSYWPITPSYDGVQGLNTYNITRFPFFSKITLCCFILLFTLKKPLCCVIFSDQPLLKNTIISFSIMFKNQLKQQLLIVAVKTIKVMKIILRYFYFRIALNHPNDQHMTIFSFLILDLISTLFCPILWPMAPQNLQ